ncbi:hypothetical protein CYMTET_15919 [Cymbomonas tetramitiformis]|uniref:Uncharacterized protein n=1 Tax=Cymbomonas tetramitiformis TaxID=36881 RepID=A0AAE0GDK8_9CHLO|nr:hypothetical protein CYMTET_15919 [Cymbomonas tetramitiformis]
MWSDSDDVLLEGVAVGGLDIRPPLLDNEMGDTVIVDATLVRLLSLALVFHETDATGNIEGALEEREMASDAGGGDEERSRHIGEKEEVVREEVGKEVAEDMVREEGAGGWGWAKRVVGTISYKELDTKEHVIFPNSSKDAKTNTELGDEDMNDEKFSGVLEADEGKYTAEETLALPLAMLLIDTSEEATPAAEAICMLKSALNDVLKLESVNADIDRAENVMVEETPVTVTTPGGGHGDGGGDGRGGGCGGGFGGGGLGGGRLGGGGGLEEVGLVEAGWVVEDLVVVGLVVVGRVVEVGEGGLVGRGGREGWWGRGWWAEYIITFPRTSLAGTPVLALK